MRRGQAAILRISGRFVTSPDGIFYPNWDDELRQGLKRESELFFESVLREDRNIIDLLTADYTFVDERLARHYGIPNIYGARFRRIAYVESSAMTPDRAQFAETVAQNRGVRVDFFSEREAALRWLGVGLQP